MLLFAEFLLRLAFGLAGAMAIVSPRFVTSGYFRNHLYVTMGLALLAALLVHATFYAGFWPALAAAGLSYGGSLCWLYEKPRAGKAALVLVALAALAGALLLARAGAKAEAHPVLQYASVVTSGGVLGAVMAAMLLGHWYLNSPGMQLTPLRQLLIAAASVVALHSLLCGFGLALELRDFQASAHFWLLAVLRWSFGLIGVMLVLWLAWRTLDVPNTQSATGLLYVAVIGTFVGETASLLLSAESSISL
jgi:hypothetical protein